MNMYKKVIVLLLSIGLLLSNNYSVYSAEGNKFLTQAEILKELGLFEGTNSGFELDNISNRAEAAVMMVRLIGAKDNALEGAEINKHPFNDVPDWADPYVAYLYENGLTKGISKNTYGSKDKITANQYATILLRALGYSDTEGLYKWDTSLEFAESIGMLTKEIVKELKETKNEGCSRDYIVKMSYDSLFSNIKDTNITLISSLYKNKTIKEGAIPNISKKNKAIAISLKEAIYNPNTEVENGEMRAVWISYLELQPILENKSEEEFRKTINKMFNNVKDTGLNTVIVQVRPFGDALYSSQYFPWSYILTGKEGRTPGFDPLNIMIEEAHNKDLKIEAWINPYRVRYSTSQELSVNSQASEWLNDDSNRVFKLSNGIFYNPAKEDVRELIVNGVIEIVKNYNIDGIHFDDYFYPSTDLDYDSKDYLNYVNAGGNLSQEDWRRENVDKLVKAVYSNIKEVNTNVQFGISPQGNLNNCYNGQYIDVEKWVSSNKYIDYIAPQIYFGFNNESLPYSQIIETWNDLIKSESVKLYIGIAAYKLGTEDKWAGTGLTEWINDKDILKRMIEVARNQKSYEGFMLFRYDFLWNPSYKLENQIKEEIEGIKEILSYD
ncbi:MAG: glycoside hydrolase family 10 protein [Eubacteriales bacterium]